MQRREIYCDVCGNKMTYQDSGNETCIEGIDTSSALVVTIQSKTGSGSAHKTARMQGLHFCGFTCIENSLDKLKADISFKLGR